MKVKEMNNVNGTTINYNKQYDGAVAVEKSSFNEDFKVANRLHF